MIARRLLIRGRVQGVFYRNWAVDRALSLGIKGWVRNTRSGDVEILAMGEPESVEDLERDCRKGPFGAKVEEVSVSKAQMEPLRTFERRPTV